jgi:hypothetical protein
MWGCYTDNSTSGASLAVTDASGATFDSHKYRDMAFDGPYNGPFQTRETTFELRGDGRLTVALSAHSGTHGYLQGVWIEPVDITGFAAGKPVSLAAYPGAGSGLLSTVEFYADGQKVGSSATPPYACEWTAAKSGIVSITATVTDSLGVSAASPAIALRISSPPSR